MADLSTFSLSTSGTPSNNTATSGSTIAVAPASTDTTSTDQTASTNAVAKINTNGIGVNGQINPNPIPTTVSSDNISQATPLILPDAANTATTQSSLVGTQASYMTPPSGAVQNNNGSYSYPQAPTDPNAEIKSTIQDLIGQESTKGTATDALNTQYGVDQKQQDYLDAFNQYNQKKVAYDQQTAAIYNQPGITREQADAQASEVSRVNNADLANLAVIATNAQGNYQGALDIVQRKISAEFDPIQQQITNLGQFVQTNNANLTDSQKAQIQAQQYQLQNNLDLLKTAKTSAYQFALQQGIQDPNVLGAIDKAQTPQDAYAAVGGNESGVPTTGNASSNQSQVSSQYQSYVTQTIDGSPYVGQDKLANLTPYQQQEAAREYAAAGIPVLNSDQTAKVQNIDVTRQNLDGLQTLVTGIDPATGQKVSNPILGTGILGRVGSAISNTAAGITQSNPSVASFNNYRLTAINTLQSLGAGQGGARISAGEIATAVDNLPTLTDNVETAQAKLAIVNGFLSKWNKELIPNSNTSASNTSSEQSNGSFAGSAWN